MNSKQLKENLGSLVNQCTAKNFVKGYDPVTELIDNIEIDGTEVSYFDPIHDSEDECEKDLQLLEQLIYLNPGDLEYETVYFINYYGNGFYYCAKDDDIFYEKWKLCRKKELNKNDEWFWYYHGLTRFIMERLHQEEIQFQSGVFEQTPEGYAPYVEDWLDYKDFNDYEPYY